MDNFELTKQLLCEFSNSIEKICDDERDSNHNENQNTSQNTTHITLDFVWIEGLRTGSRLVWVPSDESIYYSNAISKQYNGIACTCFEQKCNARIYIMNDGTASKQFGSPKHNHGSLYHIYKERVLYSNMKARCQTALPSTSIRDIYNEAVVL